MQAQEKPERLDSSEESLLSPSLRKNIGMLNKGPGLSLIASDHCPSTTEPWRARADREWGSLRCQSDAALSPVHPHGLVGPHAGLLCWKLDFFHREMEQNHLVLDEPSGMVSLGTGQQCWPASADGLAWEVPLEVWQPLQGPCNKSCHYRFKILQCICPLNSFPGKLWRTYFQALLPLVTI